MGDDYYNPWTAQTYVKRVPFWQVALSALAAEAFGILLTVAVVWFFVAVALSDSFQDFAKQVLG